MAVDYSDKTYYCRKCMKDLSPRNFHTAVDNGFIDSNGKMSVCKSCINDLYDTAFEETGSIEKAIHKLCVSLNIKFSNDAVSATIKQITTLQDAGKNVNSVFGMYKTKIIATQKSMDKSSEEPMTYEDMGAIYVASDGIDIKDAPIPKDRLEFWGEDLAPEDIRFLEKEYRDFTATYEDDTHTKIVLLKQVCYTELDIKKAREEGEDPQKSIKLLQELMKSLTMSPNAINASNQDKGEQTFGEWIRDIERMEPAQWLLSDPRGDMYRDVGDVEKYFNDFIVRPLKNLITGSKDFNIEDDDYDLGDQFIDESEEMFDDLED